MKAAIDAALGYKKGPNGEALDPLTGKPKVTPDEGGEKKGAKPPAADDKHPNGAPKKNEKGEDLDAEGKVIQKQAPKLKTAAELDLKPEEKKALHTKTQARFAEVISTLKAHETTIAQQAEQVKTLTEARDAIIGVMRDTQTTQDELGSYLEYNLLLKQGTVQSLNRALEVVNQHRTAILQALGKEEPGVDLLADFPDLAEDVSESRLTRERALEIAQGRRDKVAREQASREQQERQRAQTQTAAQRKQEQDAALVELEKWTASLAKTDLDYKAKEDKLLAKVDGVIKKYPPNLWLSTLQMMYEGIEVQKAPASPGGKQQTPLRPSGAKPGGAQPKDMLEAINQGLGYAKAANG